MHPAQNRAILPPLPWADTWTSAGVIEVLKPLTLASRHARICAVVAQRLGSVSVLMDGLYDPHNGAAVLRSCDAFGIQQAHVVPRDGAFHVSTSVAKGSQRWVDVIRHDQVHQAIQALGAAGLPLVASHPEGRLTPPDLAQLPRLALVLGNEHDGINPVLREACDDSVRIPMRGFVESLNVSVSAAILLAAASAGRPGDLSSSDQQRLIAQGLFRSVPRAAEVLANLSPR